MLKKLWIISFFLFVSHAPAQWNFFFSEQMSQVIALTSRNQGSSKSNIPHTYLTKRKVHRHASSWLQGI